MPPVRVVDAVRPLAHDSLQVLLTREGEQFFSLLGQEVHMKDVRRCHRDEGAKPPLTFHQRQRAEIAVQPEQIEHGKCGTLPPKQERG